VLWPKDLLVVAIDVAVELAATKEVDCNGCDGGTCYCIGGGCNGCGCG